MDLSSDDIEVGSQVLDSAASQMVHVRRTLFALITGALVMAVSSEAGAQTIIVRAARLIDGRGGAPLEPAMVRIAGDRIEEVGSSLPVPAGATVIDLAGATLMPGLI